MTQTITGATLQVLNPANGYASSDPTETYSVFDVSTPVVALQASGSGRTDIFADLGTGNSFGTRAVSTVDNGQLVSVDLNSAAVSGLNFARGGAFAVGGALTTIVGSANQYIFGFSSTGTRQLVLNLGQPEDWYKLTVTNTTNPVQLGTSTPADGSGQFNNTLNPRIELYDPSETLVASGIVTGDGRNEFIDYTPLVTGDYRIRITAEGAASGEYFLSTNFTPTPNNPPTIVTPATASPNPVADLTTNLSVLGADPDTGESSLTYTWSVTAQPAGAPTPTFSRNGTHERRIRWPRSLRREVTRSRRESPTLAESSSLERRCHGEPDADEHCGNTSERHPGKRHYAAVCSERSRPVWQGDGDATLITWSIESGVGTINATGLYTAPTSGTGTATVWATSGTLSGIANVTVVTVTVPAAPTNLTAKAIIGHASQFDLDGQFDE